MFTRLNKRNDRQIGQRFFYFASFSKELDNQNWGTKLITYIFLNFTFIGFVFPL